MQAVNALPGTGANVPLHVLGLSTNNAYYADDKGLSDVFALYFMPMEQKQAVAIDCQSLRPSEYCQTPYVIFYALNIAVVDTDKEERKGNNCG